MTEWKEYRIEDIATLSNGINFSKSAYSKGIKLVGVSDFKDRMYPDYDSLQEVDPKVVRPSDYLNYGDIVFVRSNGNKELVGRCMMIDKDIPASYSGFCIKLRLNDTDSFNPVFFTYLCKTKQFRKKMAGTAVGANIQNLSQARLGRCVVKLPSTHIQNSIATILSRYDSLIENYHKQIKLLEEAAQRLYKEWFVDLRFPGYENVKVVDGVPEGWFQGKLEDIAYESGKRIDKRDRDEYSEYMPIDCLPKKSLTYIERASTSLAESSLLAYGSGDILFGAMRPYFHKVCFAQAMGITRSTCFVLNAKDYCYWGFLLMFLFDEKTISFASSISVGTTMPYVRWKEFKNMLMLIPDKNIASKFSEEIQRYKEILSELSLQIRLLAEARDRLLPKLMSGEIEV